MIIELKTFEDMTPAEQRQHVLDVLVDENADITPEELESLRKVFLQRTRREKSPERTYFTCKELGELVGMSADTIRKRFIHDTFGVDKRIHSGPGRKRYTTLRISRAAAKRRFPDLNI